MEYSINKNIIAFDNGKCKYEYDINTGICKNAKTKRELKAFFPQFSKFINEQYYNAPNNFFGYLKHLGRYVNKLDFEFLKLHQKSIQFAEIFFKNFSATSWSTYGLIEENFDLLAKHFADLKKEYESYENLNLYNFIEKMKKADFIKKYNLNEDFDDRDIKDMMSIVNGNETRFSDYELIDFCSRVTARGYRTLFNDSFIYKLRQYIEICDEIEMPLGRANDFAGNYIDYYRIRESRKEEIENRKLAEIKEKMESKLSFENDEYIVKIPSCTKDFLLEANSQHNCVYHSYLPKVLRGECYIVFIRKKSNPNECYITCEIYKDGRIGQYLETYNNWVQNFNARAFKVEYEKFLKSNFLSN